MSQIWIMTYIDVQSGVVHSSAHSSREGAEADAIKCVNECQGLNGKDETPIETIDELWEFEQDLFNEDRWFEYPPKDYTKFKVEIFVGELDKRFDLTVKPHEIQT